MLKLTLLLLLKYEIGDKWKQKGVSYDVKQVWHKVKEDVVLIYLTGRKFWQEDRQELRGCASKDVRKVNQYFVQIQKTSIHWVSFSLSI